MPPTNRFLGKLEMTEKSLEMIEKSLEMTG